jgi:hypothetical protein
MSAPWEGSGLRACIVGERLARKALAKRLLSLHLSQTTSAVSCCRRDGVAPHCTQRRGAVAAAKRARRRLTQMTRTCRGHAGYPGCPGYPGCSSSATPPPGPTRVTSVTRTTWGNYSVIVLPQSRAVYDDHAARRLARHEVERIIGHGDGRRVVDPRRRLNHF